MSEIAKLNFPETFNETYFSTTFAWRPKLLTRQCCSSLTLEAALVRETLARAHEGAFDEEEHPWTHGQLRDQADTEVVVAYCCA